MSAAMAQALEAPPLRYSKRQEEILDTVEAVFLREGVRGVRIGALAAEASCSRSTLYELAPSKEALLLLMLERLLLRVERRAGEAISRATDPVERVRAMMTSNALDFAALGPQFLEGVRQHLPTRRLFERRLADGRVVLQRLIEDAVEAGQFRPVRSPVVAEAIIAVAAHFSDPRLAWSDRAMTTGELAELVDVFIDGLRSRPEESSRS